MVWNVRGMNCAKKKCEVMHTVVKFEVDIMGLFEMKLRRGRQTPTREYFGKCWDSVSNSMSVGDREGDSICVLWNLILWKLRRS